MKTNIDVTLVCRHMEGFPHRPNYWSVSWGRTLIGTVADIQNLTPLNRQVIGDRFLMQCPNRIE